MRGKATREDLLWKLKKESRDLNLPTFKGTNKSTRDIGLELTLRSSLPKAETKFKVGDFIEFTDKKGKVIKGKIRDIDELSGTAEVFTDRAKLENPNRASEEVFLERIQEGKKNLRGNPWNFQNKNQEKVIHSSWEKGNNYRFVLEGTGDIFREASKVGGSDYGYITEKLKRIEKHIQDESFGIHPEDSFTASFRENRAKFNQMLEQWKNQPTSTDLQKVVRNLNIAMLEGRFVDARGYIVRVRGFFER